MGCFSKATKTMKTSLGKKSCRHSPTQIQIPVERKGAFCSSPGSYHPLVSKHFESIAHIQVVRPVTWTGGLHLGRKGTEAFTVLS